MKKSVLVIFLFLIPAPLWAKKVVTHLPITCCMPLKIDHVIHFNPRQSKIREVSFPILREVAQIIKSNYLSINYLEVEGHSDARESPKDAKQLSLQRANEVILYLTEEGIPESILHPVAWGSDHPEASNETEQGRTRNRRVEFKIRDGK